MLSKRVTDAKLFTPTTADSKSGQVDSTAKAPAAETAAPPGSAGGAAGMTDGAIVGTPSVGSPFSKLDGLLNELHMVIAEMDEFLAVIKDLRAQLEEAREAGDDEVIAALMAKLEKAENKLEKLHSLRESLENAVDQAQASARNDSRK
ncbi:MAG: hypothetical protein WD768_10775 [Phycisphaeraceae bacterium]